MMLIDNLYAADTRLSRWRNRAVRWLERPGLASPLRQLWRQTYRLFFSYRTVTVSVAGIQWKMAVPDVEALECAVTLGGEEKELKWFIKTIAPATVFWDVGANIGLYSLCAACADTTVEVHAFEPVPINIALLNRNKELNALTGLTIHPIALSDRGGEFEIYGQDFRRGYFSLAQPMDSTPSGRVTARQGDALVAEGVTPPTMIKIDVEGYEYEVLAGMCSILSQSSGLTLLLEQHDKICRDRGVPLRREEKLLQQFGFRCLERWPDLRKSIWLK